MTSERGVVATRGAYVLGLFALANLLNYASRNVPFAVYDDLRARYLVDSAQLGWLGTAFMLPHALATIPVGWLGDRTDRRRLVALGALLWTGGSVLGALAPTFELVVASRFLVGLGTATVVPVANAVLGQLYRGPGKASALAIFNLGLFLGGVVGFGVGAGLGFPVSWLVIAAPGLVVALGLLALDLERRQLGLGELERRPVAGEDREHAGAVAQRLGQDLRRHPRHHLHADRDQDARRQLGEQRPQGHHVEILGRDHDDAALGDRHPQAAQRLRRQEVDQALEVRGLGQRDQRRRHPARQPRRRRQAQRHRDRVGRAHLAGLGLAATLELEIDAGEIGQP